MFTLWGNTKATDDTTANYSFACSVDFTIDPADKITMRDVSYPREKINLVYKNIDD